MSSQEDYSLWGTPPPHDPAVNRSLVPTSLAPPPRRAAAAAREKAAMSLALLEQWQNDEVPSSPEPSSPIGATSDVSFEDAAATSGSESNSSDSSEDDESDSDSNTVSPSGGGALKTFASAQAASQELCGACYEAEGVPVVEKGSKKWTLVCSSGAGLCPWSAIVWRLRIKRDEDGRRMPVAWCYEVVGDTHVHQRDVAAAAASRSPTSPASSASPSSPLASDAQSLAPTPSSPPRATRFRPWGQALAVAGATSTKAGDQLSSGPAAPPPFFPRLPSPPSQGTQHER